MICQYGSSDHVHSTCCYGVAIPMHIHSCRCYYHRGQAICKHLWTCPIAQLTKSYIQSQDILKSVAIYSASNDVIEAYCYEADKGSDCFLSEHVAGQ